MPGFPLWTLLSMSAALAATLLMQGSPPPTVPGTAGPASDRACGWISSSDPQMAPLARACAAAQAADQSLPNFVCDLQVTRTHPSVRGQRGPTSAVILVGPAKDVVTAEVTYLNGEERFSNLRLNGKPTDDQALTRDGGWTQGEFSPPGLTVLDGRSAPTFTPRGERRAGRGSVWVFEYQVAPGQNRSWSWQVDGAEFSPPFHGALWIDTQTGLLRRLTMQATELDASVPFKEVSTATEYEQVRIEGLGEFLLPLRSEARSCQRRSGLCSTNVLEFRNCRRFAGKARIVPETTPPQE